MQLRLAGVLKESVVDGPGLRIVVFTQGCPHNCQGCHNTDTHDPNGGYGAEVAGVFSTIAASARRNKLIRGVTFSGGEPFYQSCALASLSLMVKGLNLNIITYTGYTLEALVGMGQSDVCVQDLLENTDILIDGPYLEKERDLLLAYRGSRNQRILNVKASLEVGRAVLWQA